jgi:mannitol-1-phosphate 5-dehydrogenase
MKKAVHFGAGNIGRGFLGQLYSQSGWETVFIEVVPEVLEAINSRGRYDIHIVDKKCYDIPVTNVRAVDGRDVEKVAAEIGTADIVSTAVGANVLERIALPLAKGIERRGRQKSPKPLNILLCENLLQASQVMRRHLAERVAPDAQRYLASGVGLVETVISRMVPLTPEEKRARDPLYIEVEEYAILPVDAKAFVGDIPDIRGLQPRQNFAAYTERKLFTHNCGHVLCALWGYEKGYTFIWEATEDDGIRRRTLAALRESGEALIRKHGFTPEEHYAHIDDLIERFRNRALGDTIFRVARDPIRKLGRNDRLVGAALLATEYGIRPENLVRGIVSALRYDNPEDPQALKLQEVLKNDGLEQVLGKVCELESGNALYRLILDEVPKSASVAT